MRYSQSATFRLRLRTNPRAPIAVVRRLTGYRLGFRSIPEEPSLLVLWHELGERELFPIVWTDGSLSASQLTLATLDELEALAPYGREFDAPLFEAEFFVEQLRPVGAEGNHLMLELSCDAVVSRAIWFRALNPGEAAPISLGDRVRCAFKLSRNRWKGRESLQLMVEHAERLTA